LRNIPFNKGLAKSFPKIRKDSDLDRWVKDDLSHLHEPERSVLHSFLVNLKAYASAVPVQRRYLQIHEIYSRSISEGPSFAKWISGLKTFILARYNQRLYMNAEDLFPYDFLSESVDDYLKRNSEKRYEKSVNNAVDRLRTLRTQAISEYVKENNSFPAKSEGVIEDIEKRISLSNKLSSAQGEKRLSRSVGSIELTTFSRGNLQSWISSQ